MDVAHPMDTLSEELLLLIFGGIHDAATLLDCVPLVCKRWRRVARDPRAWAGVSVRSEVTGDCCRSAHRRKRLRCRRLSMAAARALLRAPALRRVTLALQQKPSHCEHVAALLSALRRGRAAVRELAVECSDLWSAPLRGKEQRNGMDHVLEMLRRSRELVRALRVTGVEASSEWWRGLWDALRLCGKLERLDVGSCVLRYDGQLAAAGCLLQLREFLLKVDAWPWGESENALLADAVAASTCSLRRVVLWCNWDSNFRLSPAASLAISQCRELRDVYLPLQDASAVIGMARLRRLHLSADCKDSPALLESCVAALQHCQPLAGLRELIVEVDCDDFTDPESGPNPQAALKAVLQAVFAGLGRLAANATSLRLPWSLKPGPLQGLLSNLVQPMAGLEVVELGTFPVQALPLFVGIPALRKLSGKAVCLGSGEAVRACVCGGAAVEAFKCERSDVEASGLTSGCSEGSYPGVADCFVSAYDSSNSETDLDFSNSELDSADSD